MSDKTNSGFCTDCGIKIPDFNAIVGDRCPFCGSKGIPCGDDEQVTISVNWHELHILTVWAENWAHHHPNKTETDMRTTVNAIAHRLEKQFPDKHKLTLAGELSDMKREYPNLETNVPGVE